MARQSNELLTAIGVPRGLAGYLDWATGLLRVNASYDAWARITRTPDPLTLTHWERSVRETITHEAIHFLQITTTSYLYDFAVTLFALVKSAISFPVHDVSELPTRAMPELAARLRSHFATLDDPGPEGVTVRSLAEGQAMLAQLRIHWRDLTVDEFLRRLTGSGLPSEYSLAYLLAHKVLGDAAYEIYPFLSSIALCTRMPPAAFVTLCRALKARGVSSLPSESVRDYVMLANELHQDGHIVLTGTSAEVINDLPEHPLYSPMVVQLNDLADETSILDFMAAPHHMTRAIAELAARPVVFNRDAEGKTGVHVPDNWRPDLEREARIAEARTLVLLMTVSARLLKSM